jgi:HEAT repeat protein
MLVTHCRRIRAGAVQLHRLVNALDRSGSLRLAIDGLGSRDHDVQVQSVRILGAIRLEAAVPALEPLLASGNSKIRVAAARALGRIGGVRAADALLRGLMWRRGPALRLTLELARAAPDLYVESKLTDDEHRRLRSSLALATGLRRRRTAVRGLCALVESGSRNERMTGARALGWIGGPEAATCLAYAMRDPDWQIRSAAVRALGTFDQGDDDVLVFGLLDPEPRVRSAAENALTRRHRTRRNRDAKAVRWR